MRLGDDDPQAVLERHAGHGRQHDVCSTCRERMGDRQSSDEEKEPGPGHFAASACGSSTTRVRFAGTRYVLVTRCTSAAVTASQPASRSNSLR